MSNAIYKFMNMIPPANSSKAQDLLIKLVQVLSPLTARVFPASFFFGKHFFIPPSQPEMQEMEMRSSVQFLTNLTEVQKEMGEWLEETAVSTHKSESKSAKDGESHAGQKLSTLPKGEGLSLPGEKTSAATKPQLTSISKQAQILISQVREAIGKLSNSSYFKDPQEEPLRKALKKIKPHLDKIIEMISLEETLEKAESGFTKRHPTETTREHLFNKIHSKGQEPSIQNYPGSTSTQRKTPSERADRPLNPQADRPLNPQKEKFKDQNQITSPIPKRKENKEQAVNILTGKILATQKPKEDPMPRSVERSYLPGAPYQFQEKNLNSGQRKKKRKGFWFKEEEKERDHSD